LVAGRQSGRKWCLASADIDDQLRQTFDVLNCQLRIYTTLEAVTGIGGKIEAA
jgi:hypothetical protein